MKDHRPFFPLLGVVWLWLKCWVSMIERVKMCGIKARGNMQGPGWFPLTVNPVWKPWEVCLFWKRLRFFQVSSNVTWPHYSLTGLDSHHVCLPALSQTAGTLQQARRGLCHLHLASPTLFPSAKIENMVADFTLSPKGETEVGWVVALNVNSMLIGFWKICSTKHA